MLASRLKILKPVQVQQNTPPSVIFTLDLKQALTPRRCSTNIHWIRDFN